MTVHSIFHSVTFESFSKITDRVRKKILELAARGDYVLIGHSLGGILIRNALASLPEGTKMPDRVFLLGSPISATRTAKMMRKRWFYRQITGDCGQLLGSDERMNAVPVPRCPATSIVGRKNLLGLLNFFVNEPNDGIVTESEAHSEWIAETIIVPVSHLFLPSNRSVSQIIVDRMESKANENDECA